MTRILALVLLLVLCSNSKGQLFYHDHVRLAKQAMINERCDSALIHYQNAFHRYVGLPADRASYANALKCSGEEQRCLEELLFAIDSLHLHDYQAVLDDSCYQTWKSPELYITFLRKADSVVTTHLSGMNTHYRDQLLDIEVVDQHIRKVIYELEVSEQLADTVMKKVWKALGPIDSLNTERLLRFIATYGYPDIDMVGLEANKAAWLIIQHSDLEPQEALVPLLKASCERGQTPLRYYAYVFDRLINNRGSSYVKYGCSYRLESDGILWLRAQDPSCINYYREQVGLPPLNEFRDEGPCLDF
jgi:hypothetical protein